MNNNQNQQFHYEMPDDDEEEDYLVDGGNEMVDMEEDDEAQPENDQLANNKPIGMNPGIVAGGHDENSLPYNKLEKKNEP